jgi:hypothetical protein
LGQISEIVIAGRLPRDPARLAQIKGGTVGCGFAINCGQNPLYPRETGGKRRFVGMAGLDAGRQNKARQGKVFHRICPFPYGIRL